MDGPSSTTGAAFRAALSLLGRSLTRWMLPVVVLSWLGAIPEAIAEYYAADLLALFTGPGALDGAVSAGGLLILIILLAKLIVQLVALLWAFIVLADVAAGRPVDLMAGLRRTMSLRLQFSWLLGTFIVGAATGAWGIGGCLLLLPFGFAVVDAYEADSGLGAFGRSVHLGLARSGPGDLDRRAWPVVTVSTIVLSGMWLLSCGTSVVGGLLPGSSSRGLLDLLASFDATRPDLLLGQLTRALAPAPDLGHAVTTILLSPKGTLLEVFLIGVQLVVYHDAVRAERAPPTATG